MLKLNFPIKKSFDSKNYIYFGVPLTREDNNKHEKLVLETGSLYNIKGLNGMGKTTILNILSLLTDFDGNYQFTKESGISINGGNDIEEKDLIRLNNFTYIFQDAHLINMFTVEENLSIVNPDFKFSQDINNLMYKISKTDRIKSNDAILQKMKDLQTKKCNSPYSLSGGEKQLLSFIRAMIKPSNILFADEPWSNMDYHLEEFVKDQIRAYLMNNDIFSKIRSNNKHNSGQKNLAITISHVNQNKAKNFVGKFDKLWNMIIPVKITSTNGKFRGKTSNGKLELERYIVNEDKI